MSKQLAEEAAGWVTLQQARGFIKQKYPYFYITLLGLIPKAVGRIGTMFVTDRMVLGIDFVWFAKLEVDVAAGCLIHEIMHVLRDLSRIKVFEEQDRAGYAFDIPINDDLRRFGIKLPDWVVYSSTYKFPEGLTGEGYYDLLKNVRLPECTLVGAGKCGSCSGYGDEPDDEPSSGKKQKVKFDTLVSDEPGRTDTELQYFKKAGIQAIRDHVKNSRMPPGSIPGTWQELLNYDGTEQAVVPWQSVMPNSVGRAFGRIMQGHTDYSLRRPSKRSYAIGLIRPGLITYEPTVAFIEDSSGSMGDTQLRENRTEAGNAMTQLGLTEVWFLNADVHVQTSPKKIRVQELKTLPVVGRGGTNFCDAIHVVMKLVPKPDLILYSTDGDGEAPPRQPKGVEFIWLLAPGPWTRSPCSWGIQILTTNDKDERKKYKILQPGEKKNAPPEDDDDFDAFDDDD